ncbi:MAG: YaiI/YqxD family protein [Cobetia crustatorum]
MTDTISPSEYVTTAPSEHQTTLWVDADACPRAARDILVRAAERTATPTWFVANHQVPLPRSVHVKALSVPAEADAADQLIVERAHPGDMVITSDLPLALEAIEKGAHVMTTRGEILDADNIRARVQMRDFMESMRSSGEHTGGPSAYGQREQRDFGNALDRWLAKVRRPRSGA